MGLYKMLLQHLFRAGLWLSQMISYTNLCNTHKQPLDDEW